MSNARVFVEGRFVPAPEAEAEALTAPMLAAIAEAEPTALPAMHRAHSLAGEIIRGRFVLTFPNVVVKPDGTVTLTADVASAIGKAMTAEAPQGFGMAKAPTTKSLRNWAEVARVALALHTRFGADPAKAERAVDAWHADRTAKRAEAEAAAETKRAEAETKRAEAEAKRAEAAAAAGAEAEAMVASLRAMVAAFREADMDDAQEAAWQGANAILRVLDDREAEAEARATAVERERDVLGFLPAGFGA